MSPADLLRLGVPPGEPLRRATDFLARYCLSGGDRSRIAQEIQAILGDPSRHVEDPLRGAFARALVATPPPLREALAPCRRWGSGIDPEAAVQMENACRLPVSVAGALMPDAHVGYGLPIGGVLATRNAVIPYAVGVDIACRMRLTVLDLEVRELDSRQEHLARALERETRFGVGATFAERRDHAVMEADWSVSPITKKNRDRAWGQLGTSGSGNHFVEFGKLTVSDAAAGLAPGEYVALLSHSGSRGTGAAVCEHYSRLAAQRHPGLPRELSRLAWLELGTDEGREYWAAMELMGRYAAANHALIHHSVARALRCEVLLDVENHHNFAWRESHVIEGVEQEVIVHRKGATPAGAGALGIIPGSMADPGFVVRGRGEAASLHSASHGAGRRMSRTQAKATFDWEDVHRRLRQAGVRLLSAGLDEAPMAYKDIHQVMAAQSDLVEVLARFDPRLVRMAPAGERPED